MEEELSKTTDAGIIINYADGQLTDLTFDLDHVIQDEVGKYHHCILAHLWWGVSQPASIVCRSVFINPLSAKVRYIWLIHMKFGT